MRRVLPIVGFTVLVFGAICWRGDAFAQDETIISATQLVATVDQSGRYYPLASPTESPLTCPALGIFWADFSQLTNAISDVRNFDGETQYGITVWRLRLTRSTNEVTVSYPAANTNLWQAPATDGDDFSNHYENVLRGWCIMSAALNYESYDDLIADGYTNLAPKRLVVDIWLADANDCSTYDDNVAAVNSVASGITAGGFTAMDEDPDGLGGDPCSVTNLSQAFFVTGITAATNRTISISFQSCQIFRYLISYANSLSNNESWIPLVYVWGQPNASSTTWTDAATTNDDGGTITQRFYRVERILGSPIATGAEHSVALTPDGKLWTWGWNDGNLGDGLDSAIRDNLLAVEDHLSYPGNVAPVAPCDGQTITNAVGLAAGGDDFTLVIDANGMVWTFGENTEGQLGYGSGGFGESNLYDTPTPISGISNVVSVAAGFQHALALRADMKVFAWGDDSEGQLGVGGLSSGETNSPIRPLVPTATNFVAVAAGRWHSLALDTTGRIWAWGFGSEGQLGNGGTSSTNLPILLTTISNVIAIAAGDFHTIALAADYTVWTWGYNDSGQLGDGTTTERNSPVHVSGLSNVVAIAGGGGANDPGGAFSAAVTSNGLVYAWGDNTQGQLGTNSSAVASTNRPMLVAGISNVVWISAPVSGDDGHSQYADDYDDSGGTHIVAMTVDQGTNHYWGWGDNDAGEVGNGISSFSLGAFIQDTNQYSPVQVQFCTRCQRTVQLGTTGSFTAQCNGTLYLYFNDEIGLFYLNSGSYTVSIHGVTTNVPAYDSTGYGIGIAVGMVTNGGGYSYSASGLCFHNGSTLSGSDANGNDTNNIQ